MGIPIGLTWGATARLDDSLVANPLDLSDPTVYDGTEPGRNARPDPIDLFRTSMDNYSKRLSSQFFGNNLVDRGEYTVWILAALGLILSIWVVAGLGLMTSVEAISFVVIPTNSSVLTAAPLYAGLLAVLCAGFVGILFTLHRARDAAWREPVRGFAGFAWDVQD